jgi:5-methylthioadenosine/S-adenosylhomocysteine deaminase
MALLIRGGQLLNSTQMALETADVLIEADQIVAVGCQLSSPPGTEELNAAGHLILPGLVNAHTHAHKNLFKGLGDNWTLEDLLTHGPALNGCRTPEDHYLSAAIGAIEMLKTGCTAAYDLFMSVPAPTSEVVEAVVRAYIDVGLRAVVAPAVADVAFYHAVPDLFEILPPDLRQTVEQIQADPTEGLLELTETTIRLWHGAAGGRIRVAVAPTIPGQCSDDFLVGCGHLTQEYGVGLHTHLAESKVQAVYAQRRWGTTIVGHLADLGLLTPGFVGAHGVWLTPEDIQRLADAGAAVAHNPTSNLKLGSGIAPTREMLNRGLTVGLGTDGSMSSDNLNMFEAMRCAALVNQVRFPHAQENWVGAKEVYNMATQGSARALGLVDNIGAVALGRKADLVLLRANSVFLQPLNQPLNALVYAETGADVTTVLVGGRVVLDHGRVLTVDEGQLQTQAQKAADRLRAQNTTAWGLAQQLRPYVAAACRAAVASPYPVNRYAVPIISEDIFSPSGRGPGQAL